MRVLLDTHVWLWFLFADSRLAKTHRAIIEDEQSELMLSAISVWELHLLVEKRRIPVNDPKSWLQNAFAILPVSEAPITFAIAQRSRHLPLPHQDPADRFIAATAVEMRIPLMTVDSHLLACTEIQFIR